MYTKIIVSRSFFEIVPSQYLLYAPCNGNGIVSDIDAPSKLVLTLLTTNRGADLAFALVL
jgi:hypothetical protein